LEIKELEDVLKLFNAENSELAEWVERAKTDPRNRPPFPDYRKKKMIKVKMDFQILTNA
jgi:hypothetical protein